MTENVPLSEFIVGKRESNRIIKVDMREPDDIFDMLKDQAPEFDMEVKRAVLETGDYVFQDVGVERKEKDYRKIDDVITKAEELSRKYIKSYVFISTDLQVLIDIEETKFSGNRISSLRGLTASLIERGINPIFTSNRENFVRILLKTFDKHADEKDREVIQPIRPEPTREDWQTHIVCGLPDIGEKKSYNLIEHFGSVKSIMNASKEDLMEVDGIGSKIAERIVDVIS